MDLIDTHLHVIDMAKLTYAWIAKSHPLGRDHLVTEWQQQAKRVGITAALHMEVDVAEGDIENETTMVEGLIAAGTLVIGGISSCRPEHKDFLAFLERAVARKAIKGFRRVLHVVPDGISQAPLFRENIKRLSKVGLPFDLCAFPRQLPLMAELADLAPDVQFVLDHCGNPDIKGKEYNGWAKEITALARRPNMAVKISGVSAYADPESWEVNDLKPYVEHCIASFGWDRVVWGSDWPVVTLGSSLPLWVSATQAIVAGASADEKAKLFSRNARRIWKLA